MISSTNYFDYILLVSFFDRPAQIVAPALLGKYIVRRIEDIVLIWKIVEVEAYLGTGDAAVHSARWVIKATQSLFTKPWIAYVHRMRHHNLIDIAAQIPNSILIRVIEPVQWIDYMKLQRWWDSIKWLSDDPWKVCQVLNIKHWDDWVSMTDNASSIVIYAIDMADDYIIVSSSRIGITKDVDLPLRFYLAT